MNSGSRLVHSNPGLIRACQMSAASVFFFVEGKTDRPFYSKLCETILSPISISYEIRLASELAAEFGSGKQALLSLHDKLVQDSLLLTSLENKKTVIGFFLDKDVDDYCNRQVHSVHLIYTEFYTVDNYYFRNGDLQDSVCEATNVDIGRVRAAIPGVNTDWLNHAAATWLEWTAICLFVAQRNLGYRANYNVNSCINRNKGLYYDELDKVLLDAELKNLQRQSKLTSLGFKRTFNRTFCKTEKIFRAGDQDKIFNGKWYACFLAHDAEKLAKAHSGSVRRLPDKLRENLRQSLHYSEPWTDYFKEKITAMTVLLN